MLSSKIVTQRVGEEDELLSERWHVLVTHTKRVLKMWY
jgi:hypothetical protein